MGEVVRLPLRNHARTPKAGRGTPAGHSQSSGHRSENQSNTSSYFRAVKVVEPSTTRSKKRQSPAAKRPMVDKLTSRAAAYADAQAMRFDLNSDSMVGNHSRKIPTMQAKSVGKFRLAENSDTSDKSAMATAEEVRARLTRAFEGSKESSITLALEWGLERNHIREFLIAKKDSLKHDVIENLSVHFGIPIDLLTIRRQKKKRKSAA